MIPETLSISRLKSYTYCAEKYRLERVEGKDSPPAAWTIQGTAFHNAYEAWERGGRAGNISDRYPEFYDAAVSAETDRYPLTVWQKRPSIASVERDLELYLATGMKQCDLYQQHCEAAVWKIATINGEPALEIGSDSVEIGTVKVRFKADAVLEWPDGQLTVRDFKTGKLAKDNRQIGFYKLFLWLAFRVDISRGEYWYSKTDLNRSGGWVDLSRYTYEYAVNQFEGLMAAHKNEVFIPNPGRECDLCTVKEWCREMGWNK